MLATTSSVFGGALFTTPTLLADISRDDLSLELHSASGSPYQVFVHTPLLQLVASITLCAAGVRTPASKLFDAAANLEFVGLASSRAGLPVTVVWEQTTAASDGRCVWMNFAGTIGLHSASADDLSDLATNGIGWSFTAMLATLTTLCGAACPLAAQTPVIFSPGVISSIALVDSSASRTPVFVSLVDTLDPSFVGCPYDLHLSLAAGARNESILATWVEPFAVDNVAIARYTGPFGAQVQQGMTAVIAVTPKQSPLRIVYEALDTAGRSAKCTFHIFVDYPRVSKSVSVQLSGSVRQSTSFNRRRRGLLLQVAVAALDLGAPFFTLDAAQYNSLSLRFEPPSGQRIVVSAASMVLPPVSVDAQILLSSVDCGGAFQLPFGDEFTTVTLGDVQDLNGSPLEAPLGWFQSAATNAMVPAQGFVMMGGQGSLFTGSFSFASLTLTLGYPRGRVLDNITAACSSVYTLAASSYVGFHFVFDPLDTVPASLLTFRDIVAPQFTNCPLNITSILPAKAAPGSPVQCTWAEPTVTDNIAVAGTNRTAAPGAAFALTLPGTAHTVRYTAWDAAGNIGVCSFNIAVLDNIAPTVSCPTDSTLAFNTGSVAISSLGLPPTGVDDNSPFLSMQITFTPAPLVGNSAPAVLVFNSSYTYNSSTSTFTMAPTLPVNLNLLPTRYSVALTLADLSGNSRRCNFTVRLIDSTAPLFAACPSQVASIPAALTGPTNMTWQAPSATDNDAVASLETIHATTGAVLVSGQTTVELGGEQTPRIPVMFVATDRSRNQAVCNSTLVVATGSFGDSTTDSGTSSSSFSSMIPIIAAVGGAALLVVVIAVVVVRRRARAKPIDYTATLQRLVEIMTMPTAKPNTPREIKREHIKILNNLGKGQFGTVDKAILDERVGSVPGYLCAVKQLLTNDAESLKSLMEESAVMAQLDCDHCLRLIGVITIGAPMMMVLEFCEHGALAVYLKAHAGHITEKFRLVIASDCSEGLLYLTKRGFIHRDVSARNVLLSSELRGKISDFGMSREAEESEYYQSRGGLLPVRWCAPEVLEHRKFSSKSDCWALGVLLYEIWTDGALPYAEFPNNMRVWAEVVGGYRLARPPGCTEEVYQMMYDCWWEDPQDRVLLEDLARFFRDRVAAATAPDTNARADNPESYHNDAAGSQLYDNAGQEGDALGLEARGTADDGASLHPAMRTVEHELAALLSAATYDMATNDSGAVAGSAATRPAPREGTRGAASAATRHAAAQDVRSSTIRTPAQQTTLYALASNDDEDGEDIALADPNSRAHAGHASLYDLASNTPQHRPIGGALRALDAAASQDASRDADPAAPESSAYGLVSNSLASSLHRAPAGRGAPLLVLDEPAFMETVLDFSFDHDAEL
jgi:serine/threonine protein kinase